MTGYAGRSEPVDRVVVDTVVVDVVVVGLGGLGSATAWQLARRGVSVVGLERFELGHLRGASHDTSRILRRSYHTPAYVRLAGEAYDDWADLERLSGERLVTVTGGVDLFPPGAAIPADDYAASMVAGGVPFEQLDAAGVGRRWPALRVPEGTVALQQDDTAIVPAGRSTATMAPAGPGGGRTAARPLSSDRAGARGRRHRHGACRGNRRSRRPVVPGPAAWCSPQTPGPTSCWHTWAPRCR